MIKQLLFIAITFGSVKLSAQSFSGMYPFTAVTSGTTNSGTTDPTPSPTAAGLTFGSFSAVGTPSAPAASGAFAFTSWPNGATNGSDVTFTGSINPGQYYQVTLSPTSGSTVSINSITFNMSRSSTGPRHWAVRGSADTYSVNLPASIAPTNTNLTVSAGNVFFWAMDSYTVATGKQERGSAVTPGASYSNQTNPMTFRFYAWDAESGGGSFRIDTAVFNGTASVMVGLNKLTYDLNSKFKVYPNPSNDGIVTIEAASSIKIEVLNILGDVISSENNQGEKVKMDLSAFPPGVYFIRIHSGDKMITEKLILSK
ncbi:MAG: T9SS type A sorting domain-containing protein [Bacteroidetes bacterium]|nr:T9SS type A sorting domain-containing protein [Bacteroidota bacterium]